MLVLIRRPASVEGKLKMGGMHKAKWLLPTTTQPEKQRQPQMRTFSPLMRPRRMSKKRLT